MLLGAVIVFGLYMAVQAVDFSVYCSAAKQLLGHDYDLYRQGGLAFRYAPVIAFAFIPFSFLPLAAAAFLWYLLKIAALIAIAGMVMKLMNLEDKHFWKILVFSLLITGGYIVEEIHTGNIHFLVLFLIVLALFQVERGKIVFPSFLMAVAICIKVTPFLFLLYFALARRWKICLFCFLWLAVLILAPGFFIGWEKNLDLAKNWMDTAVARAEEPVNHSLNGVLFKYLTEKKMEPETEKYPRVNLLNLRVGIVKWIWLLTSALILFLLYKALLRKCGEKECVALKYALLTVSLLLLSPHDSRIYFSTLFFPCAVLVAFLYKYSGSEFRAFLLSVLGLSFILNTLLPALMPGRRASLVYETLSPYFFSALFIWIALWLVLCYSNPIYSRGFAMRRNRGADPPRRDE